MQPRIAVLTIGVDNLERSVTFYRDGLGLETPGIIGQENEHGAVAFFDLEGGGMKPRAVGWLRRLFSGSRRTLVGSRLESSAPAVVNERRLGVDENRRLAFLVAAVRARPCVDVG